MTNPVASPIGRKDSFIVCTNSQRAPVRGSLMHFSYQNAIFEVYNPFSILQLSEVLAEFKIVVGERTLYAGRAVVRSLVNTGIMLVCEVTLVDAWADIDVFALLENPETLRSEMNRFVHEWKINNDVLPNFKVLTGDFHGFLSDLSIWLKQIEAVLSRAAPQDSQARSVELVSRLFESVGPTATDFLWRIEEIGKRIPPEQVGLHKAYIRREIHPLTLCCPFVHRTFTKPLGYAGDYEMINMILDRPYDGGTLFAKTLTRMMVDTAPARAHRNRISILKDLLIQESDRNRQNNAPLDVLNVGCGPAKEVRDFIATSRNADFCRITLMDFSREALECARQGAQAQKSASGSQIKLEFISKSIDELLRESMTSQTTALPRERRYDFVYCAGLFDYFTDSVCRRLISLFYDHLLPGGLLCVTNIHSSNPQRHLMEYLLEWNVFHRTNSEFNRLAVVPGERELFADPTGANIFLNIRRPA
ncbi:MAG: class I SAM-dependent methyltransferase [Verrucomicrobia bacterium]|jgi:extracellular factor (EF) 3-hydroxypalmitic acid methyl ester biosynthesis protein|nr:class I SAM-dependent methyltransferase [Verrucomicrobiota bacterium]